MVSSLLARCVIVTIGTLYPGYRSYKALMNADDREIISCLQYWIVFSIFLACETVADVLLSWFPFYYWIKIFVVLWMISPVGSKLLYKRFVRPVLKEREQEIDQLLEQTKQKGYSTLLDLTNKGIRYASGVVLNTAVFGQAYLGEHLKRSLSTSDIDTSPTRPFNNTQPTLQEEDEEETDQEFNKRLKEDQKYLSKSNTGVNRRPRSQRREKPEDLDDHSLQSMEMENVMEKKKQQKQQRPAVKVTTTVNSSNENAKIGTNSKRQIIKSTAKKPQVKSSAPIENEIDSSTETDNDSENENPKIKITEAS